MLSAFVLALFPGCSSHPPTLQVEEGDHVIFIGNTLAERMQYFGHFETLLHARFPEHKLVVRNLGYSADEIAFRPRSLNFGSPDDHLTMWQADVILAFFGFNESFAGPAGLDKFKTDLAEFIQHTKAQAYNGESAPRLALISPIAHEDLENPNYADGSANNVNLEMYTRAMKELASRHDVPFVDLFTPSLAIMKEPSQPLTFNGIHLHEEGHSVIAEILDTGLFGDHPNRSQGTPRLRAEVNEKNFFFFHRYRAVNGYYIYGGRSQRDNGNPPFTDAYVLENERGKLDDMVVIRDERIWNVARGLPVSATIDDSHTRPLHDVPTNLHETARILPPEEALKKFKLAPGYAINLFASEVEFPELQNSMQLTFDSRGRLWILTMPDYPMFQPPNRPNDRLLILEDVDGNGRADKLQIFAEGLHLPTGFELGDGGVYVAQQPNLMFLKDTDGDDRADVRKLILHGFDSADSHHSISAFTWGPGGGLYMHEGTFHHTSVETPTGPVRNAHGGVYRFDPTTQGFETFVSYNFANPWGHVFDAWGQDFVADASGGHNYFAAAFSGKAPPFTGQPDFGPFKFVNRSRLENFIAMRVRPTSGCEIVSSRHFPPAAQGNFLLNNVIGFQGILQHKMEDEGSGFLGTETKPLLFSSDRNFRPVALQFGPDGALYVVDWFNPLIGHMQHNLRDPNRDKSHGRVWRITYPSRPLVTPPEIDGEPPEALLELLESYEDRTRYRVRLELREHDSKDVIEAVKHWIDRLDPRDKDYQHHLLEALWVHQHHNAVDLPLLERLLRSPDYRARAAATRVLGFWRGPVGGGLELLRIQANDEHPRVRLEAVRALSFFEDARAAEVSLQVLKYPMDYYLSYTLNETIAALKPFWEPLLTSGRVLVENNLKGTGYLLGLLDVADLQKVAATRAAFLAFLSRPGVDAELRQKALDGLAQRNSTSHIAELLQAIRRVDEGDATDPQSVLTDLGGMLASRSVDELRSARGEIEALVTSARKKTTRRIASVALIVAEQGVEAAWERAARSEESLLDLLETIPLISDPRLRSAVYPKLEEILTSRRMPGTALRSAAIKALPSIPGRQVEALHLLTGFLASAELAPAAVYALDALPREELTDRDRTPLLEGLLGYLKSTPARHRTSEEALAAIRLADELTESVSSAESANFRARLADLRVTRIVIRPLPHRMQYDRKEIFVPAGRPVEIVFENVDIMPHNLIITSPGALVEVGMAAEAMAARPDAFDRQFIPDSPSVLYASKMLQPQQTDKIQFTAPKVLGDYPYVCTFPGHWRTMFGTMYVVSDLEKVMASPRETDEPPATAGRDFVRTWRMEDLEGLLKRLDSDRNFTNGANLFGVLSCSNCHQMNGQGGQVGPDLARIKDKLAAGELDRSGLLRELVEPSKVLEKKYQTEVIKTRNGRLFSGMVAYEDARVVRLISNPMEGEETDEVPRDSIAERWQSPISPMPEGLLNTASSDDILDLLAYVASAGGLQPTVGTEAAAAPQPR